MTISKRDEVVQEALSWVGTPYHHLADVKGAGIDCAMLLVAVYRAVGLVPADLDPRPYAHDWHLHRGEEKFLGWLEQYGRRVDAPRAADVAVWRYGRTFSHGAIVVSDAGAIVHAYQAARCVTHGHLQETDLAQREARYYRIRGAEA